MGNFRFQLDWKLGFRVIAKNCKPEKAGSCWPQRAFLPAFSLCLLLIDGATYATTCLQPLFVNHMWCYLHGSQRATEKMWAGARIFIAISRAGSGFAPRSNRECGNFVCQEQWWEKFPHSQLDLGANPESAPEMAINSLPPAHILSCSLTTMVITSHMSTTTPTPTTPNYLPIYYPNYLPILPTSRVKK